MEIKKEFQLIISKCIERLLRSETFKPFGLALLRYDIILTNQIPNGAPAITDYKRIYINPENPFYTECQVPLNFIITFVLVHEIGHIIFMHDKRRGNKDPYIWKYATDYMLNLFLKNIESENKQWETQQKLVQMNIDSYMDLICIDEKYSNMLEEEIYEQLQQEGKIQKNQHSCSYKDFLDNSGIPSNDIGDNEIIQITETELELNGSTQKKTFMAFPQTESSHAPEYDESIDMDNRLAKTMLETNILRKGTESVKFEKFLKRLFNVFIPWEIILQDSILIELQLSSEISYGKPKTTWLVNPSLPYLPNYEQEEVLGTLVLIIDESASMSDSDIRKAIDIAQQADAYYKNIFIIKHDTRTRWVKLFPDKLTQHDINELLIRRHSGGTSHKDAFMHVMEFDKNSDCYVSLVLVITDMISDIKDSQSILPRRIPRIYLQNNSNQEHGEIEGKIISIKS